MSYWNYRVIRFDNKTIQDIDEEFYYQIHEVYYRNGEPVMWSQNPAEPYGSTFTELKDSLSKLQEACVKPILTIVQNKLVEIKMTEDNIDLGDDNINDNCGC